MQFPDASGVPANMLYPQDGTAFDMLARFIGHEYADPADMEMRGMAAALGIVKGKAFMPDAHAKALLDKAARAATRIAHVVAYTPSPLVPNALWYKDRHWINVFPGNATFTTDTFNISTRAPVSLPTPIPPAPGWPSTWRTSGQSIRLHSSTPTAISSTEGKATSFTCRPYSRRDFLVGDRVRPDHRIGPGQRPAVSLDQHHGQAISELGRDHRYLFRPEFPRRGEELAAHPAWQGLLRYPPSLRP